MLFQIIIVHIIEVINLTKNRLRKVFTFNPMEFKYI